MTMISCDELARRIAGDRFHVDGSQDAAITVTRADLVKLLEFTARESRLHVSTAVGQAVSVLRCFSRLEDEFLSLSTTFDEPGRALADAQELVRVAADILDSIEG